MSVARPVRTHYGSPSEGIKSISSTPRHAWWTRRGYEVLWVDKAARGRGIGSRLLAEAERLAKEMGARNAALETFEWQAPRFYERHGYEEVARIEGYAKGFYLALMKKAL